MSIAGCSNAMIAMQLLHGLRFTPDFVIISFTTAGRFEFDKRKNTAPDSLHDEHNLRNYLISRYSNSNQVENKKYQKIVMQYLDTVSEDMELFKNYLIVNFCLEMLKSIGIDFTYSLGGMECQEQVQLLLRQNFLPNSFSKFEKNELPLNLWNYGNSSKPFFHVGDDQIQSLFANECQKRIYGKT